MCMSIGSLTLFPKQYESIFEGCLSFSPWMLCTFLIAVSRTCWTHLPAGLEEAFSTAVFVKDVIWPKTAGGMIRCTSDGMYSVLSFCLKLTDQPSVSIMSLTFNGSSRSLSPSQLHYAFGSRFLGRFYGRREPSSISLSSPNSCSTKSNAPSHRSSAPDNRVCTRPATRISNRCLSFFENRDVVVLSLDPMTWSSQSSYHLDIETTPKRSISNENINGIGKVLLHPREIDSRFGRHCRLHLVFGARLDL